MAKTLVLIKVKCFSEFLLLLIHSLRLHLEREIIIGLGAANIFPKNIFLPKRRRACLEPRVHRTWGLSGVLQTGSPVVLRAACSLQFYLVSPGSHTFGPFSSPQVLFKESMSCRSPLSYPLPCLLLRIWIGSRFPKCWGPAVLVEFLAFGLSLAHTWLLQALSGVNQRMEDLWLCVLLCLSNT